MGLMPQDAYYSYYADHLAWSYFDHPPMVAYMIKCMVTLFGKQVIVLKLGNLFVTLLTTYYFYNLSRRLISKDKVRSALILLMSTFMISILGGVTTPDVPLLFFWTLALIWLHKSFNEKGVLNWAVAGFFIGMAINSKYTAIFLVVGVLMFLLISESHRRFLFSSHLLLLVTTIGLTIFPVVWWNYLHDWVSFSFQGPVRVTQMLDLKFRPHLTLGMLGLQCFLLLPCLFVALLWAFYRNGHEFFRGHYIPPNIMFLMSFSMPLFLFFLFVSPIYWIKLNWVMPAYITAIMLASIYMSSKWIQYQVYVSTIIHLLFAIQIIFYPINVRSDDTWWGWVELASSVDDLMVDYPDHFIFSADGYKTSAVLSFYSDSTKVYGGNVIGKDALQFSIVDKDLTHLENRDAIFVDSDKRQLSRDKLDKYRGDLTQYFEHVRELEPILIRNKADKILRKFLVYHCCGYKGGCIWTN